MFPGPGGPPPSVPPVSFPAGPPSPCAGPPCSPGPALRCGLTVHESLSTCEPRPCKCLSQSPQQESRPRCLLLPAAPPAPRGEELKLPPRVSETGVEPEACAPASDSSGCQTLADDVTASLWEVHHKCESSLTLCPSGFPEAFLPPVPEAVGVTCRYSEAAGQYPE